MQAAPSQQQAEALSCSREQALRPVLPRRPRARPRVRALGTVFAPVAPPGAFEFRVGDEVASIVDGEARAGSIAQPDVVVETNAAGFHDLFVERRWDGVAIEGDRELLERLVDAAMAPAA